MIKNYKCCVCGATLGTRPDTWLLEIHGQTYEVCIFGQCEGLLELSPLIYRAKDEGIAELVENMECKSTE